MLAITVKSTIGKKACYLILTCISLVAIAVALLLCLINALDMPKARVTYGATGEYSTVFDEKNPSVFIKQFDKSAGELFSCQQIYIPSEFNATYKRYNRLQKKQGLDLEKHKGKQCQLYVYELKKYNIDNKAAYISVVVYRGRVIAGHISNGVLNDRTYTFYGE